MSHDEMYEQPVQTAPPVTVGPTPAPGSNDSLLAQVSAFGDVAREANDECPTGKDAIKEMVRRRNLSGQ